VGVPGELCIGGEGVSDGYLNRPELTASRFVSDQFRGEANARLYRTGDLARYRPDGNIEFLGRADSQVKLRGHRIELGEIEAALARHPAVRQSVTVVREDAPGDQRLVAYLVPRQPDAVRVDELRQFLLAWLPDHMVPAVFVCLDALPQTPHGKIDRRALPAPAGDRPELRTSYVAPRTRLERVIAGIWRELLQVDKVGLRDNFFDLGGNSLLLVRAHARLCRTLDVTLPVIAMLEHPTVGALAALLGNRHNAAKPVFPEILERAQRQRAAFGRHPVRVEEPKP
jgi:hypothetical protein